GMGEQTADLVFETNKVYELLDEFTHEGIRYKTTSESTVELVSGAGCSGDVVIPQFVEYEYMNYAVTSIANSAFKGCTQLTSISIPREVNHIGAYVFDDCPALKRVEWNAYYCETYREEYNIYPPFFNYVTSSCSVEEIVFGNDVHVIPSYLCTDMKLLKNIELPASVVSIGNYAFAYCEGLQSVTFPEALASIGEMAFGGCTSLSTLTIPRNVAVIGGNAFQDCVGLTSVKWDAINCRTYAPNGYVYPLFVAATQGGIMNIEKFEFGSQVQIIPIGLCWELSKLQSVEIPQSVKEIDDYAFYRSGLKSITVPSSVSVVGASAFWGCEALESVTLAEGLQEIGNYAFSRCSNLKSIVVPNSVQRLGDEAFWGCSNLQSATIGDGVTYIGNYTFSRCENLASVVLGKNIGALGQEVFWSCSSLRTITLPESLTEIGQ
ncbi:MAG: leucine-rich repeat protein, partial [Bacteroidales bacterium]|nr:leucine-rich repeat protein [Bacteroidales bacterium]